MSATSNPQSAVPSALGYYYQGLYALLILFDAGDDAAVSIETDDDVVLNDSVSKLIQLKHSTEEKQPLSIVDVGFWKAIRNWNARHHDGTEQFVFITRAPVAADAKLAPLLSEGTDRTALLNEMVIEAERVIAERQQAEKDHKDPKTKPKLPHQPRAKGCADFLALSYEQRRDLLKNILIVTSGVTAHEIPNQVDRRINNAAPPAIRVSVVERLIQWWDREIVLSLLNKRNRAIKKQELQSALNKFLIELSEYNLPDDFSLGTPGSADDGITRTMQKQIEWVNGGASRLNRAAVARWRARNQRDAWVSYDVTIAKELDEYDKHLIECWEDNFKPAKEDCTSTEEAVRAKIGRDLLDWSHLKAHIEIRPIRRDWPHSYLIQGSFQQLADQEKVGWHPDYEEKLKDLKGVK